MRICAQEWKREVAEVSQSELTRTYLANHAEGAFSEVAYDFP